MLLCGPRAMSWDLRRQATNSRYIPHAPIYRARREMMPEADGLDPLSSNI